MKMGYWVWPPDYKAQQKVLRKVQSSPHLMVALSALAKSKDGMSNAEVDDVLGDNSEWMTLWVVRQLTSLGFISFNVDFFGNSARYRLTDLGRSALAALTGQPPPAPPKPPTPAPTPVVAAQPAAKPA